MAAPARRWTSDDLATLPDEEGTRYEIIDGELFVAKSPHWHHQFTCGCLFALLNDWSRVTGTGVPSVAPGVIFDEANDVIPDVVWASNARLASLDEAGHLHAAPELVVEVLSPGAANERRDREAKLRLYSRRGVDEYWIVDWRARTVEVYRCVGVALERIETLSDDAILSSPLLPGFVASLERIFPRLPRAAE